MLAFADADAVAEGFVGCGYEARSLEDGDVTMWFGVHAFGVKAKVFGESMEESTLVSRHGLEAEALFNVIDGEDTELSFLLRTPFRVFGEKVEGFLRIRDVLIKTSCGVDVECQS